MKNLLFLIVIIFLSSCSEDVSPNYSSEKKIYHSNDAKVLNELVAKIPNSSENLYRSNTIPNSEITATSDLIRLIDKTSVSNWKDLDLKVKSAINRLEENNENKKYDIAIQNATYRFLVNKLYKIDNTQNVANELKFYLELLISKQAIEWDILTYGILKLENESDYNVSSFKKYTIEGAKASLDKYIALKEQKSNEKADKQFFHQNTLSHYQRSIDDANYALTYLLSND